MDRAFALSHHPLCKDFLDHTFRIGNYRVCKGCLIGYPTALTIVLIGGLTSLIQGVPYLTLLFFTLFVFGFNLLKLTPLGKFELFSIFLKFIRGATLGLGLLTTWKAPGMEKSVGVFIFLFGCYIVYIYAGFRRHIGVCRNCHHYPNIPHCPGLDLKNKESVDNTSEHE